MLYVYYHAQIFAMLPIIQLIWVLCKGDRKKIGDVTTIILIYFFHVSLMFLTITPLVYIWVLMAIFHMWIHIGMIFETVVQTGTPGVDEKWHVFNQLGGVYYLWSRGISTFVYYAAALTLYFPFLGRAYKYNKWTLSYSMATCLEGMFILCLRPFEWWYVVPLFLLQLFVSGLITYDNKPGLVFLCSNVAGCAFLSEAIVLYLLDNNIY